jgi:cation diffusion facilitator CzcD-associated flavoprotein CzcO
MDGESNDHGASQAPAPVDVVIVGAGFAGLYMLHRMRQAGRSVRGFEAGSGVGGTWYWNRYPGARCDVESLEYSYQFSEELQQEWEWTERYAGQAEILRYLDHVADRFDLRRDITFDTRVDAAHFDETADRWTIRTSDGASVSARFVIMAAGCLSSTNTPDIDGIERFTGPTFHTGRWPHEPVDFTGQRVGLIGTGSSGIQLTPLVADQAAELVVFQRTPNFSVPARNGTLDPDEQATIKADYATFRANNYLSWVGFGSRTPVNDTPVLTASDEEREREFEARWRRGGFSFMASFNDIAFDREANEVAAEFVRTKIRQAVTDGAVANALAPGPDDILGCKRLCLDSGYYETFNRPNVQLVDLRTSPLDGITEHGISAGGTDHELDCIIFATGFDAMTGTLNRIDIRGRDGQALRDKWAAGPTTYLGLGVAGFPNLFNIAGPGSPSVLTNMVVSIEQQVNWITDCIGYLDDHGSALIEATQAAEDEWVAHVNEVANYFFYPSCNSWYLGANIPGKPRVFMPLPGLPPYIETCNTVAANDYEGFTISS